MQAVPSVYSYACPPNWPDVTCTIRKTRYPLDDVRKNNRRIGTRHIIIGGGVYWYMQKEQAAPTDTQQAATTTPQVAGQDAVVELVKPPRQIRASKSSTSACCRMARSLTARRQTVTSPSRSSLGEPGIIPGFQIGINGMKVGGERRISIPPELGYGNVDVHQKSERPSEPRHCSGQFNHRFRHQARQSDGRIDDPGNHPIAQKGCKYEGNVISFPMLTKRKKQNEIGKVKRHDSDTGSPEVQVALLTRCIEELSAHLDKNRKDKSSRRGLWGWSPTVASI